MISFRCVIWMLEKAGINPSMVVKKQEAMMSCVYNIVCWWLIEHHQRKVVDKDVCFPGEVAMPQVMVLSALWSAMCGYKGDWERGRYPSDYKPFEQFSFLGNQKGQAIFDMLQVYGTGALLGPVWRPVWYQSNFLDWVREVLNSLTIPDIWKHDPTKWMGWCKLDNILYLYMLVTETPGLGTLSEETGLWMWKVSPVVMTYSEKFLIPKWGMHLQVENYDGVE